MAIAGIQFREANAVDVPAMMLCHPADEAADTRMAAYFAGNHHPQQALAPRVGYVATADEIVVGYIAGHRTTRHGCAGELQYFFVSPKFRRRGIATKLIRLLAQWFRAQGVDSVCVALAGDSPPQAKPFCESVGATPLKKYWYVWPNIGTLCD